MQSTDLPGLKHTKSYIVIAHKITGSYIVNDEDWVVAFDSVDQAQHTLSKLNTATSKQYELKLIGYGIY